MDKFLIQGPTKLTGEVVISGSKNAALPILFASLLAEKPVEIQNVPKVHDIEVAIQLLINLGAKIKRNHSIYIDTSNINVYCVPCDIAKKIRASIWTLGPLVARFHYAKVFLPGGCAIGQRPIDLHILGLKQLGATIQLHQNSIIASVIDHLRGAHIIMNKISVGATITIMIAATLAHGITIIENAAQEPEITDTANFLITLGAKITGLGTNIIKIEGVKYLNGGTYRILPDRIETGTFLVGVAASRGYVTCHATCPNIMHAVLNKLREAGGDITTGKNWITLNMHGKRPKAVNLTTAPYPGFPTDMQSQFSLLNLISEGTGTITETIFENRFMHFSELIRMGAYAHIDHNTAVCYGVRTLFGTQVIATDLRSAASLILAGCIAKGTTIIHHIYHVERGYDKIEEKLKNIGANIQRIKN